MRKGLLAGLVLVASTLAINTAFAGPVGKRQVNQQKRIHQGVKSGELTKGEFRMLEREQATIQKKKRAFKSDGQVTPREAHILDNSLDRSSRHIFRLKHNGRDRN